MFGSYLVLFSTTAMEYQRKRQPLFGVNCNFTENPE